MLACFEIPLFSTSCFPFLSVLASPPSCFCVFTMRSLPLRSAAFVTFVQSHRALHSSLFIAWVFVFRILYFSWTNWSPSFCLSLCCSMIGDHYDNIMKWLYRVPQEQLEILQLVCDACANPPGKHSQRGYSHGHARLLRYSLGNHTSKWAHTLARNLEKLKSLRQISQNL